MEGVVRPKKKCRVCQKPIDIRCTYCKDCYHCKNNRLNGRYRPYNPLE